MSLEQYDRIFVAGHRGLVGSSLVRALHARGHTPLVCSRTELDLTNSAAVHAWFRSERPQLVFLAAAKVGGIQANNTHRWDFLYENLAIEISVLSAALAVGTERVVFLGSSCIYPKMAPQPIHESALLTGSLEPTNEPYAIAKIAGLKLVESANIQYGQRWVSLMPTNLYGPGDNFDLETSHVVPAMIRKFHEAKFQRSAGHNVGVTLWGSGTPRRELLYVDDLAAAALHIAGADAVGLFNVGYGSDLTIRELASLIATAVEYEGPVSWDTSKPDGTPQKLLDSSRIIQTGWTPCVMLEDGLRRTYEWYLPKAHAAGELSPISAKAVG